MFNMPPIESEHQIGMARYVVRNIAIKLVCCFFVRQTLVVAFNLVRHPRGLTGSALGYRSLPPEFESRCRHI